MTRSAAERSAAATKGWAPAAGWPRPEQSEVTFVRAGLQLLGPAARLRASRVRLEAGDPLAGVLDGAVSHNDALILRQLTIVRIKRASQ
jgi:hypothetical protein